MTKPRRIGGTRSRGGVRRHGAEEEGGVTEEREIQRRRHGGLVAAFKIRMNYYGLITMLRCELIT